MVQGVICIGVHMPIAGETVIDKVYRNGNWCVLSCDEFTRRLGVPVPDERHAFVDQTRWQRSGLPKFGKHGASHEFNDGFNDGFNEGDDAEARVA